MDRPRRGIRQAKIAKKMVASHKASAGLKGSKSSIAKRGAKRRAIKARA